MKVRKNQSQVNEAQKKDDIAEVISASGGANDTSVEGNDAGPKATGDFDYSPTKSSGRGMQVKQAAIARAISGNGGTGSTGVAPSVMNAGLRAIPYSGADARIIDNASGTPAFNKSDRRDSRYGQKTDNTARHINYVPSETYELEYDGPKPLSESPDSVQGSLGHPANEYARIQKGAEAFPGALNFERSVDEMTDDVLLATSGQQLEYGDESGYNQVDPTITFDKSNTKVKKEYNLQRGNYIPRTLHARYEEGKLVDFYYDEDVVNARSSGDLVTERANTNRITQANQAEVDRLAMAHNAGNEVQDTWSPIPYAYPEPTRDVMYLSTIEKQLGAQVFAAVKSSARAHSYQLNKATKDGMVSTRSAVQMALGDAVKYSDSTKYDDYSIESSKEDIPAGKTTVFSRELYEIGAPSAIVAMYDSPRKYHDRADFLTQPRSWNMILKQGLSGYKSFRMDPTFARVYDNVNVFSTIDRAYDPSSTTCILDGVGLMNAYSLNQLGSCFRTFVTTCFEETNVNPEDYADGKMLRYSDSTYTSVGNIELPILDKLIVPVADYNLSLTAFAEKYLPKVIEIVRSEAGAKLLSGSGYAVFFKPEGGAGSDPFKCITIVYGHKDVDLDGKTEWVYPSIDTIPGEQIDLVMADNSYDTFSIAADKSARLSAKTAMYNDYLAAWYKNRQNWFYLELRDPYTDGLKTFLRLNAGTVSHACNEGAISWPICYGTKDINAYSYLVMAAIRYMQEQRAKALLDVLNYTTNFSYPFGKLVDCGEFTALGGSQYGQSDIFELLEVRTASPTAAMRWLYPEMYANVGNGYVMMPYYMTEDNFDVSADQISLSPTRAAMSYPVTKDGIRLASADAIYGFTERDVRLMTDMMVTIPMAHGEDTINNNGSFASYKYSQASDGIPVIKCSGITLHDHLATPRELGYVFTVKQGYLTKRPSADGKAARESITSMVNGHSSHRVYCWINDAVTPASTILSQGSSITARAANFSQKCYCYCADDATAGLNIGLLFGTGALSAGAYQDGVTAFKPFTDGIFTGDGQAIKDDCSSLFSYAKAMWARVQKIPCALNPFDFGGAVIHSDPFSFNYLFGLMGFRSSDFKEDIYNRLTKKMAEMWLFVDDPFITDSLICK